QFLDFMGRNEGFKNALKKHETQAIEKHDAKFTTDKLPGLLKEHGDKIRLEVNPKETDDQKANREMREEIQGLKNEKISDKLKADLLGKKAEIGYTGDIELFMHLGDKALETMEAYHSKNTEYLTGEREKIQKELYGNNKIPEASEKVVPKDIDEQIRQAREKGDFNLAMKLQLKKNIKPQQ
ncbi:hypothetical protein KA005_34830, partial [bacterium]|nr:hypothetical protein [bacterium]